MKLSPPHSIFSESAFEIRIVCGGYRIRRQQLLSPPQIVPDCHQATLQYSIQMFSFHRLIHVKGKYFSRNTPPLHSMLHAFLRSNIGGKVFRVKREGLGLYVDDVPPLQFTLL